MADMSQFEEEFAIFASQHSIRTAYWQRQIRLAAAKAQASAEFLSTAKRGWSRKFRKQRYEEFVESQHRHLEVEFVEESNAINDNMRSQFFHQVQAHGGFEQMKNKITTPYTFARFNELPKELQCLIWIKASYHEKRRHNYIMEFDTDVLPSSIAERRNAPGYVAFLPLLRSILGLLHIEYSTPARVQAEFANQEQIFPQATFNDMNFGSKPLRVGYTHALQDEFYIFGNFWRHRVLRNMLIKASLRDHLDGPSLAEIFCFSKIRFLTTQLHTFAESPRILWSKFVDLKILTIVLYPYIAQLKDGRTFPGVNTWISSTDFTTPTPGTIFGERGDWISMIVLESLQRVQKRYTLTRWEIPKIETSLLVELPVCIEPRYYLSNGHLMPTEAKDTEIGNVWDGRGMREDSIEYLHSKDLVFKSDHNWYRLALGSLAESHMHRVDSDKRCVETDVDERFLTWCEDCEGEKALRPYIKND